MVREAPKVNQVKIQVNGALLPHHVMDVLLDVEVNTSLALPDMFIMRFHADDVELINETIFDLGKSVQIEYGYPDSNGITRFMTVIKGEISAIDVDFDRSGLALLLVRGYDRSHRLNRGTKTRVFVQMSDADIVGQICNEAGLSPQVESTKTIHTHVFQDNMTDLAFLQALAQRNDFEITVDDRTLHFRKPQATTEIALEWGITLRDFHTHLSGARQVDEVIVKGWDPAQKKEIIGSAKSSKSAPQIGGGSSGGAAAKKAFSSAATYVEVRRPVATQAEAEKRAQAILDHINATFVEAEGTADGDPRLVAGCKIRLSNLGQRFNGTYVLSSTTHIFSPDGYDTHFTVEGTQHHLISDLLLQATASSASAYAAQSGWGGVVPAIVTDINDPEQLARVKVKFPWLDNNLASNWARMVSLGSGGDRGFFMLPEVGDEVLVAFEHEDFNQPYVIGGLWNKQDKPPDKVVKNGKTEIRTMRSRTGHIIRMVDDPSNQVIEIIDAKNGTTITLNAKDNSMKIDSKGEVTIQSGAKMKLKATEIDIQADTTVNVKGMNVKVSGDTALDLKGGIVKIN